MGGEALLDPWNLVAPVAKLTKLDTTSRRLARVKNLNAQSSKADLVAAMKAVKGIENLDSVKGMGILDEAPKKKIKPSRKVSPDKLGVKESRKSPDLKPSKRPLAGAKANTSTDSKLVNVWNQVNPFRLTPQSRAINDTAVWYKAFSTIFGQLETTADARKIMDVLIKKPDALIEGVTGLTSPKIIKQVGALGEFKVGVSVVANPRITGSKNNWFQRNIRGRDEALSTLQNADNPLRQMKSLQGNKRFNINDFMAEAVGVLSESADTVHGVKRAGTSEKIYFAINRRLMAELWLNQNPGFWVHNAFSLTGHLGADNLLTYAKTDDLVDGLRNKFGMMPNLRLGEGVDDIGDYRLTGVVTEVDPSKRSLFRISRYYRGKNVVGRPSKLNLPAEFSEFGLTRWSGNTTLDTKYLGGRLPFGEENFYLRGFSTAFNRFFDKGWDEAIQKNLIPALEAAEIEPDIAADIASLVREAALTGGRADVIGQVRNAITAKTRPFSFRKYGINDPTLSAEGYKALVKGLGDVSDRKALEALIDEVFDGEADIWNKLIDDAPPQMGRHNWTDMEGLQDEADLIDGLTRAAKESGMDVSQVKKEVGELSNLLKK